MSDTPEVLDEHIAQYKVIRDGTPPESEVHKDAVERIERLIRVKELMEEGMEYWPAYVKARMEQGYDH